MGCRNFKTLMPDFPPPGSSGPMRPEAQIPKLTIVYCFGTCCALPLSEAMVPQKSKGKGAAGM
jgi:hypothetical protein